jgi:ankyrin repeat protein
MNKSLYKASQTGDLAKMGRLLDASTEPDALVAVRNTSNGAIVQRTALVEAVALGQLDAARLLLDRGADPCLADSTGATPLVAAARNGHIGMVRRLAACGAELDATTPDGATAFHAACGHNQPECVAALVELGCDTSIKDTNGWTGKQWAEPRGHAAVLDVLREAVAARLLGTAVREAMGTAVNQPAAAAAGVGGAAAIGLCKASQAGDLGEMGRLLDGGAEPDTFVAGRSGNKTIVQGTALVAAAGEGKLDAVRLLLDRGADPSLADSDGHTPLMAAAGHGHVGVVRELAARGAALDAARPADGGTAFHLACAQNKLACVVTLVELGCETASKTVDGLTGKELAERKGHAALDVLLEGLLEAEALCEASRVEVTGGLAEMARLLDGEIGCDTASKDNHGVMGKQVAEARGNAVLERLEEATARRRAREADRVQREEVGRLLARQAFGAVGPLLARMLLDAPADAELLAWEAEVSAGQAGAEAAAEANAAALLAELEAEGSGGGSAGQSKSQKKKEKQRRRKEAAAAAAVAAAVATVDGVPELELEPVAQAAANANTAALLVLEAEALCKASRAGGLAEMARLLDGGAEPDALVTYNEPDAISHGTALGAAAGAGQLEAVRLLLERGADPSLVAGSGITPLMSAAGSGHAAVVRELGAHGADLEGKHPEYDGTAFHCACIGNHPECAAALVELGCDTENKIENSRTGKQLAEDMGYVAVLDALRTAMERRRAREADRAQREEVGRLLARQAFGTVTPLLARMLLDAPADAELLAWEAEVAAGQAGAEAVAEANAAALLAELEAEGSGGGSAGQSKSRKKKEKQRRRKEAAAVAAAAGSMPEPELQKAADFDVDELPSSSEAQPAHATSAQPGGKRRKKKNKMMGPQPTAGPLDIDIEPGQPERALDAHEFELESVQISTAADLEDIGLPPDAAAAIVAHFKPAPKPEPEADEPEPELSVSGQLLATLTAVPMAEWSEEQVLVWAELVELEPETRAALRAVCEDEDTDGEDLAMLPAKRLQKMLKRAGLQGDLPAAAQAVLALRDALLAPAAAVAPSLPPDLSARQNEQWHAATVMSAAAADLVAAATAAATATAVEAAKIITVTEAATKAEAAAAKAAPSCQICFEPYGGAVVPRIVAVRARPRLLSPHSVSHNKSPLYGAFVWARMALHSQKWRFPARAVRPHLLRGVPQHDASVRRAHTYASTIARHTCTPA